MVPVIVTDHAAWRAAERLGIVFLEELERDVQEACLARRVSSRRPDWAPTNGGRKDISYAWTEDQSRIYVVTPRRDGYIILTVYPNP